MKHRSLLLLIFLISILVCKAQTQFSETGMFLDTLKAGPMELRLGITVAKDDSGRYTASLNSIDQGSGEIPMDEVKIEGDHVLFISKLGIQIEGSYNAGRTEIHGEFRQGPNKFPLTFKRVDKLPVNKRPQEPKPPFPYTEEEVVFENAGAGVKLAGTLTLPQGEGPFTTVVLISGSGPQNRNEELLGHKPFLVIADMLTRNGTAVLRYDDRGVAASTGDFASATSGDFAEDAFAAVDYLKSRTEINPHRIGLIGHSEGGIIGPIAATQTNDIAFIVLLAGPGGNLGDLVTYQRVSMARKNGASEAFLEVYEKCLLAVNEIARKDISDDDVKAEVKKMFAELPEAEKNTLNWNGQQVENAAKQVMGNWWRYGLRHDPAGTLKMVRCPVLALLGEKDQQVPVALNQAELEHAIYKGNPKSKVIVLPGLNHLFQKCETGDESEYAKIEETISPEVLELISDWIKKL
jgi:uncharacterized protein